MPIQKNFINHFTTTVMNSILSFFFFSSTTLNFSEQVGIKWLILDVWNRNSFESQRYVCQLWIKKLLKYFFIIKKKKKLKPEASQEAKFPNYYNNFLFYECLILKRVSEHGNCTWKVPILPGLIDCFYDWSKINVAWKWVWIWLKCLLIWFKWKQFHKSPQLLLGSPWTVLIPSSFQKSFFFLLSNVKIRWKFSF